MRIIANSLPKSGTHLITRILDLSGFNENKLHFSASLLRRSSRNPLKNFSKIFKEGNAENGLWVDLDMKRYLKEKSMDNLIKRFPDNTFSQGHLPYSDKLLKYFERNNIKIIYIIRDPRDVVVSLFHHHYRDKMYQGYKLMNKLKNDKERILAAINGFHLNTELATASLKNRVNNSKDWYSCNSKNVLVLKFEDIVGKQGGGEEEKQKETIQNIEKFLELKQNTILSLKEDIFYTKAYTFRKGKISDWKNYFDEEIKEIIKEQVGREIVLLGYEKDENW